MNSAPSKARTRTCRRIFLGIFATASWFVLIQYGDTSARAQYRIIGQAAGPNAGPRLPPTAVPPARFRHWDLREFPNCRIPFTVDAGGTADIPNIPFLGPLEFFPIGFAALQWQAVAPAIIGFQPPPLAVLPPTAAAGVPAPANDAHNHIRWRGGPGQPAWLWGAGVIGLTCIWTNPNAQIQNADIVLNDANYTWTIGLQLLVPPFNLVDVQTIVLHELGHFLGIHHSTTPMGFLGLGGPVMQPTAQRIGFGPLLKNSPTAQDRQALNFLYTPDLGDAPDPWAGVVGQYQTLVHNPGAGARALNGVILDAPRLGPTHIFGYSSVGFPHMFERLGANAGAMGNPSTECEANVPDKDPRDDGVFVPPLTRGVANIVVIVITHTGQAGRYVLANPQRRLYFNGYFDWKNNCLFDPAEREIFWSGTTAATAPGSTSANFVGAAFAANTITLTFSVAPPLNADDAFYCRFRLDYGENEGRVANWEIAAGGIVAVPATRPMQFGEVEDYKCLTRAADPGEGGGCCLPDGNCVEGVAAKGCISVDGIFQGVGISCDSVVCPLPPEKQCCTPDGGCLLTDEVSCLELDGVQLAGESCAPSEACCTPEGTCLDSAPTCCLALGGIVGGPGTQCLELQACCLDGGICRELDPFCCAQEYGNSIGSGSTCLGDADQSGADDSCEGINTGACALDEGTCLTSTNGLCAMIGGTYSGDNTACVDIVACCLEPGDCVETTTVNCLTSGGIPYGGSSQCFGDNDANGTDDRCEANELSGACCFNNGFCSDTTAEICTSLDGGYQGVGSQCTDIGCPGAGACCLTDGSCFHLVADLCQELGGSARSGLCEGDSDNDNIDSTCDNCPNDANPDQADTDGDGVGDACDACPGGDDNMDLDGDTVPDACDSCPLDNPDDTDGDGVCDSDDVCPGQDDTVDEDGDGVPDCLEKIPTVSAWGLIIMTLLLLAAWKVYFRRREVERAG